MTGTLSRADSARTSVQTSAVNSTGAKEFPPSFPVAGGKRQVQVTQ